LYIFLHQSVLYPVGFCSIMALEISEDTPDQTNVSGRKALLVAVSGYFDPLHIGQCRVFSFSERFSSKDGCPSRHGSW